MNLKPILLIILLPFCLSAAEPLQLHDGKAWSKIDDEVWSKLPRTELVAKAHDGKEHRYSGVSVSEVLKLLSAPSGETLRGQKLNLAVLFIAKDGYQVTFSLAELDASVRKQTAILADKFDGQALPETHSPRMMVVPDDLRHSRWIRGVMKIALVPVEAPKP